MSDYSGIIKPNDMFHTPESWDEISSWIEQSPKEERHMLWIAAVMSWNMACKFVNEESSR